jgi:hypothetical protein
MSVDYGYSQILMAKDFLQGADIMTGFQQMSGEAVP